MAEITLVLERLNGGDRHAFDELVPLVYEELKRRARGQVHGAGHSLHATTLVQEAFVKLLGCEVPRWQNSRHFYNAAAEVMRQVVLNCYRAKTAQKRSGALYSVPLDHVLEPISSQLDYEALDEALKELAELDDRRYQVVMLRYFGGLTDAEIAKTLEISEKTVERDWAAAKAFLRLQMQ